jgi:hypothetical protein
VMTASALIFCRRTSIGGPADYIRFVNKTESRAIFAY